MTRRSMMAACAASVLVLAPALTSCNTVRGMGQDIQSLGRSTSRAATSTQSAISDSTSSDEEDE